MTKQDMKEKKKCCDYGNVGEQHFCTQAGKVVNKPNSLPSQQIPFLTRHEKGIEESLERFDKEFTSDGTAWTNPAKEPDPEEVKAFLKQELEACAESARKEVFERIEKNYFKRIDTPLIEYITKDRIDKIKTALSQPKESDHFGCGCECHHPPFIQRKKIPCDKCSQPKECECHCHVQNQLCEKQDCMRPRFNPCKHCQPKGEDK